MSLDPHLPGLATITELRQANEARIAEVNRHLAPTGQAMGVNRAEAILEALLDHALGTNTPARSRFELGWQEQIRDTLDQAESQLRHQEILRGINGQA